MHQIHFQPRGFPFQAAEHIISAVEESNRKRPPMPLLISFSAEEVRKQAAASTQRFLEGTKNTQMHANLTIFFPFISIT